MEYKIDYDFIAVSKVVNHKIGLNASTVLTTLIYKQQYWKDENRITTSGSFTGFYISHSDIREETCLGINAIKKGIKSLRSEGLIQTKQQGLGKPNLYSVDEVKLSEYIGDNEQGYEDWRHKIRGEKPSGSLENIKKGENHLSGEIKNSFQESSISTTTNNKTTNNKKLKTFTNRINADEDFDHEEQLMELISELQMTQYDDKEDEIKNIYEFLINRIPQFKGFEPSEKDFGLISVMQDNSLNTYFLADKICANASAIIAGSKKARFGNLFVGLVQIKDNMDLKYG